MSINLKQDTERFICAVQSRPAIYNKNLKDHFKRTIVEKLWEDVAKEMKCPKLECKHKWSSLRNSYARSLREQKYSQPNKVWYLYNSMSFMKEFMSEHKKRTINQINSEKNNINNNIHTSETKNFSITSEGNLITNKTNISYNNDDCDDYDDDDDENHFVICEDQSEISLDSSTSQSLQNNSSMNNNNNNENESIIQYYPPIIRTTATAASISSTSGTTTPATEATTMKQSVYDNHDGNSNKEDDIHLMFMKSLLPDLRKLSEKKQRIFKQNMLLNLNELLEQQEKESLNIM